MPRIEIEFTEEELKRAVIDRLSQSIEYRLENKIKEKIERTIKETDQAVISDIVTRILVQRHLGKMKDEGEV